MLVLSKAIGIALQAIFDVCAMLNISDPTVNWSIHT